MSKIFFKESTVSGQHGFSISNSMFFKQYLIGKIPPILLFQILSLLLICINAAPIYGLSSLTTEHLNYNFSFLQSKPKTWAGEYLFEDIAGWRERGSGGAVPSVSYSITVSERKGKLFAELGADGFQISDSYACTAKTDGNQLNLYYLSGGGGFDKTNSLGFKKGQLLLSLTKTVFGKRIRYGFEAGAYEIFLFGGKKKKINFSKL